MSQLALRSQSLRTASWRRQQMVSQIALYVVLSLVGLVILFPFYYMVISSLREPFYKFDRTDLDLIPKQISFEGYKAIFNPPQPWIRGISQLINGLKNTMIVELFVILGSTFFNGIAAYAFAKKQFPGKQFFFMLLLVTIILPGEVTLVPRYLMFHKWGFLNTPLALIVPALVGVWGIFLIRQFMSTIPNALIEAAYMDGASELRVITQIIFPLSMPVLSTYALFTFLGVWNDLFGPLLYCNVKEWQTLQLALYQFSASTFMYGSAYQDHTGIRMQTMFAGLVISALPTVLVFIIFQRRIVEGIVITGLKG